jgi:CheY-like chemotaxis protein
MSKAQIFVVEDSKLIVKIIQKSLKNLGYGVAGVESSGEEAIKKIGYSKPDLILMDIVLEGEMDGIEAANQIRSGFNIPVVYLTSHGDEKLFSRAKISGPYGYLIKPFKEKELHATIEMALYKNEMDKEQMDLLDKWQQSIVKKEIKIHELEDEIKKLKEKLKNTSVSKVSPEI